MKCLLLFILLHVRRTLVDKLHIIVSSFPITDMQLLMNSVQTAVAMSTICTYVCSYSYMRIILIIIIFLHSYVYFSVQYVCMYIYVL